jgi:hypothetical protein
MDCKWLERDGQCLLFLEPCKGSDCQYKEGKKNVYENSVSAVDRMRGGNNRQHIRPVEHNGEVKA